MYRCIRFLACNQLQAEYAWEAVQVGEERAGLYTYHMTKGKIQVGNLNTYQRHVYMCL